MALEISTAGVSLKYCVETTAGTRPTASYTGISGIKETPDFNPEPEAEGSVRTVSVMIVAVTLGLLILLL